MNPDVIMVGEMRDLETIDACVKAAETGHLVFSTLHTHNAASSIYRIVGYFPPEAQENARHRLAESLIATISMRLIRGKKDETILPVLEVIMQLPPSRRASGTITSMRSSSTSKRGAMNTACRQWTSISFSSAERNS
jgi:Tfp pilus assembly pilus retraction ATPase PilT